MSRGCGGKAHTSSEIQVNWKPWKFRWVLTCCRCLYRLWKRSQQNCLHCWLWCGLHHQDKCKQFIKIINVFIIWSNLRKNIFLASKSCPHSRLLNYRFELKRLRNAALGRKPSHPGLTRARGRGVILFRLLDTRQIKWFCAGGVRYGNVRSVM